MTPYDGNHRRTPALRPLTCGVLLALATLPASPLMAETLDGQEKTIESDHNVESWVLRNGAKLIVNGAGTESIALTDSEVVLEGATVTRAAGHIGAHALDLLGDSIATVNNTRISNGGLYVSGNSQAVLTGSSISIDDTAHDFATNALFGITIGAPGLTGNPAVILNNSTVTVADRPDLSRYGSGMGAVVRAGSLTMGNGSRVDADNVGVMLHTQTTLAHEVGLTLDNSHITAGRNAAIEVALQGQADNTFRIMIANGSTVTSANGDLLLVNTYNGLAAGGTNLVDFVVDKSDLDGNITNDTRLVQAELNVTLRNTASLKGIFNNVSSANIGTGSSWTLTGNSTVGHLELGNTGTVVLGNGASDGTYNTLSLDSFNGSGGTFVFNTVLGDDASLTDKVVISGDASGQAGVQVLNAGGQGAQTAEGIELITIGGASNAQFDLIGRAVGGVYEYKLVQGDDGNWYLRSELDDGTDPEPEPEPPHDCVTDPSLPQCEITLPVEPIDPIDPENPDPENPDPENPDPEQPDPEEPGKPQPVLRPETGAYLANQHAMDQLLQHSAQTRMGHAGAEDGLRTWALTEVAESRQALTGQQKLEATRQRLQVGADIGVFDGGQGRIGAMLSAGKAEATSRSTVTGYRADGTVEGGSVGAYAHWSNDAVYLDASVQHGRFRNTVHGEGLQAERYDSRAWQSAIEAGYRFNVGRVGGLALNLQPQLQLSYTDARTDEHMESNGTVVRSAGASGLSTRIGLRLQGEAVTGRNHFAPYVAANAYRDTRTAGVVFDGERIDGGVPRHRAELTVGGQFQMSNGFSAWGEVGASHGEDRYREIGARIGAAFRW